MPIEYHYETQCCGEETVYGEESIKTGDDERTYCENCGWITTETCIEKVFVGSDGSVL